MESQASRNRAAENFGLFYDQMESESDRGSVLVAVSLLDEIFVQLLKAKLVPSLDKSDELFDGAYSPFGSFSARIDLAYRVGIIGAKTRRSCHILRKIRNGFAHATDITGFDSSATQDRIRELFRLNADIAEAMSETIIQKLHDHAIHVEDFDGLVRLLGWRSVLQLLFAIIAAGLSEAIDNISPIAERTEDF